MLASPRNDDAIKPRGCAAFSFEESARAPAVAVAAAVAARMTRGEQRRRDIVGPPRRDVGHDAAVIFVGADIVDRDLAFAEQAAQGCAGGFGQSAIPRDRPPSVPAHRCRAGEPASSGSSPGDRCTRASKVSPSMVLMHVDGMPDAGIAGVLPDRLGIPRRLAVGCRLRQPGPANSAIAAAAAASPPPRRKRISRAGAPKTGGARACPESGPCPGRYLFSRTGTYSQD